jgi:hypothetical protein
MTDDQLVGRRLRAALERIQAPEPQLGQVFRRAQRRRVRGLVAAVTLTALVLVGLSVPLVLLWPLPSTGPGRPPAASAPPAQRVVLPRPRPGWTWHVDQANGVAVQAPEGWTYTSAVSGPAEPAALFAIGTGPIPAGGDCAPTAAIRALPENGVLLWVLEYTSPENSYEFPPRPTGLEMGPLLGPFECIGERTHLLVFRQAGRFFQVHVIFGPAAPAALRAAAAAALSSLRVEQRGVSTAQLCRQGSWTSCPEAAWVFQIINKAGFFHWGTTGKAIEAGRMGGSKNATFEIRATKAASAKPPARDQPVAVAHGVAIYGDGRELVWRAQGLDIWIQPTAGSNAALPSGKALNRLVQTSLEVPFKDEPS